MFAFRIEQYVHVFQDSSKVAKHLKVFIAECFRQFNEKRTHSERCSTEVWLI